MRRQEGSWREAAPVMARILATGWAIIGVAAGAATLAGGDLSIEGFWLFLLWTYPFGLIWWFYVYDYALRVMPPEVADPAGLIAAVVLAFLFWFVLLPRFLAKARRAFQGRNRPR
jgi:drug/metabolite transporter (DMT)-like permease